MEDDRNLLSALIGDGRPLLSITGLALIFSGLFALFVSATGHFLPHDVQFLGMSPESLCNINECRIVHFMFHDRVSFGGSIMAIGIIYLWLAEFPLRRREAWAWWAFAVSGALGFGSFLAYLGYGYLDSWHGVATMALLPVFVVGLGKSFLTLPSDAGVASLLRRGERPPIVSLAGIGWACLTGASLGLIGAGATILTIGMTCVFVPEDLAFMGLGSDDLHAINPRLIPLIAHDRAGFGGGVFTAGVLLFLCLWCAGSSRSFWQALALAGVVGFSTAIGVHPMIGYTDSFHLAPALAGAGLFTIGLALTYPSMMKRRRTSPLRAEFHFDDEP